MATRHSEIPGRRVVDQPPPVPPVRSRDWNVPLDDGRYDRARIGFVLIPNEQTVEGEMIALAPRGVGMFYSRTTMPTEISTDSLAESCAGLAEAAARIVPDDGLDVVCFACTSGSVAVGEERAIAELRKGAPQAAATTLITCVRKALEAVGAQRIAVVTPYADELNHNVANYFLQHGFSITRFEGLNLNYDREMVRVPPDFLAEVAGETDSPEAEAVVISCGALRSIEVIDQIEQRLGKPVVCSNQAMLWHCLRLAGIPDQFGGYGRLLRDH